MPLSDWKDLAAIVQALVTAVAVVIAAVWTYNLHVLKRQSHPRAVLTQQMTHRTLTDGPNGVRLVHLRVDVSNPGEVLLYLVSGTAWIQRILPMAPDDESVLLTPDAVAEGHTMVAWPGAAPVRHERWDPGDLVIEPGETQEFEYDFIVPLSLRTVRAYAYYKNASARPWWRCWGRNEEIGWHIATLYDLSETAAPPASPPTVTVTSPRPSQ
jgi:hypothetical protein